ncbi:MAG: ATP-binding cassette domain-containing protein [Phycisphaerales bacterium]
MYAIELQEVRKSFGAVRAVDGLNIHVPQGAVYGFLGPNGAGKTTTLRMIMDIIRPDSGEIQMFGEPASSTARSRVGYMPEERGLYRKMTAAAVLRYFGSLKGMTAEQLGQRVPAWLERIDLAGYANKKVEELSRGMHQKLQFAVTVIHDPELVILDEPFSGLDPVNQDMLREIIDGMRASGRTVLFSTHGMHEAEQLCDFIVLIDKGRVVVDGTLEQIRAGHESRVVSIDLEGDAGFVARLSQVTALRHDGRRIDVTLRDGADPQELLRLLVERARVRAFEIKQPSLHEIFVRLVGGSHVEDR